MSTQEMQRELERLKAENAALLKKQASRYQVKWSDKSDGIMVTGLRRFPVTFYADEWEALFGLADTIRATAKTPRVATKMQAVG